MFKPILFSILTLGTAAAVAAPAVAAPTVPPASAVAKSEDGKYFDKAGNPTYHVSPDGKVDWYTFSGYRRFNGTCEVCHGFDGSGSSFAPDLTQSLKNIGYDQFAQIVSSGKQDVNTAQSLVMPSFGDNKNVMCYLDDIYVYLRARADGVLPGGRPPSHEPKSKTATDNENDCMGP